MTSTSDTLAAGEGKITTHPFVPGATLGDAMVVTMHADTDDDSWPAFIAGHSSEIQCVPVEMPDGEVLQATTIDFMAWGR
jgi:hypothetical protein